MIKNNYFYQVDFEGNWLFLTFIEDNRMKPLLNRIQIFIKQAKEPNTKAKTKATAGENFYFFLHGS